MTGMRSIITPCIIQICGHYQIKKYAQNSAKAEQVISFPAGATTRPYFRPPYGARDNRVRTLQLPRLVIEPYIGPSTRLIGKRQQRPIRSRRT